MCDITDRMVRNTQQFRLLLSGQEIYIVNAALLFCVLFQTNQSESRANLAKS